MSNNDEHSEMSLEDLLAGGIKPGADLGSADVTSEGSYRRGYHQCAAELAQLLKQGVPVTAEMLEEWVNEAGMEWRKDCALDRKIVPPSFHPTNEGE